MRNRKFRTQSNNFHTKHSTNSRNKVLEDTELFPGVRYGAGSSLRLRDLMLDRPSIVLIFTIGKIKKIKIFCNFKVEYHP